MAISNQIRTKLISLSDLYFQGPATALRDTQGIVFANQPDIVFNQSVNYTAYNLTHTNYSIQSYAGTPSPTIQLTAQFSNVTQEEHLYTQGVIHFLRSVTKMFYGLNDVDKSPTAGTPPPVLRFSSFGSNQFNNIPVVVGNVSIPYQSDTDLVEVGGQALPALQTIALDLLITQNPAKQKRDFSKHAFINGKSYAGGFI
tara:strand:+ start:2676 stop:3272 length:597 start_codon:yes stop_codon:yes gene_type:complete